MREDQRGIQFHPTAVPFVSIFVSFLAHVLFIFSFLAILSFLALFIFFCSLFSLFFYLFHCIVYFHEFFLRLFETTTIIFRVHIFPRLPNRGEFFTRRFLLRLSIDSHGSRFLFIFLYTLYISVFKRETSLCVSFIIGVYLLVYILLVYIFYGIQFNNNNFDT